MTKTIYIAGPMRGIPYYNFPAFDAAELKLTMEGWRVISPAAMDRDHGFDAMALPADSDWSKVPDGFDFLACVDRDLEALRRCHAVYMLPGWEGSKGALAEKAVAEWLGLEILDAVIECPDRDCMARTMCGHGKPHTEDADCSGWECCPRCVPAGLNPTEVKP